LIVILIYHRHKPVDLRLLYRLLRKKSKCHFTSCLELCERIVNANNLLQEDGRSGDHKVNIRVFL
jgi:hypothetical protein